MKTLPLAVLAVLLLAGCATSAHRTPYKQIEVVAGPLPANAAVIGQVEGYDYSDLKEQARARGGDAITVPTAVGMRGQLQSDVIQYK